jgi:hypothetical protein
MENNQLDQLNNIIDDAYKRILDSNRIKHEHIVFLYTYGITTGLFLMAEILKVIEENGLKSAGKIYHARYMETIYISIRSEYHFRTNHFYQQGQGLLIPIELQDAFLDLQLALNKLEMEMTFELDELDNSMNQKEISYLFCALANKNYFRSNTTLLSESIALVTGYSEESITRVIQNFKSTNGGLSENEKDNLLKKIKSAIDSF